MHPFWNTRDKLHDLYGFPLTFQPPVELRDASLLERRGQAMSDVDSAESSHVRRISLLCRPLRCNEFLRLRFQSQRNG